ncbi:MAG: class I SAM-dependent methyltransferase [Pseudomonadales bacterium]
MRDSDSGWSDYWEKDGAQGEVFVNSEGGKHPTLADYWRKQLESLEQGSRIIDVASGAGSVFGHLPEGHDHQLFAVDISGAALKLLTKRFPNVTTIVGSADRAPFCDGSFDVVVSQFGAEYAGINAFAEAARLISNDGQLIALCHIRNGYIDSGNRAQLSEAKLVAELGFIDKAVKLVTAAFASDALALKRAEDDFVPAAEKVCGGMERCKKGIHTYLFFGFRELFEKRQQYDLSDISGWLEDMHSELEMNIDRLSRMCLASLSDHDVAEIHKIFEAQGLVDVNCTPFEIPGNELPVAWSLTARRRRNDND